MADVDLDASESQQDGTEVRKRVHGPKNTGYICGILCLVSIFCIAAFTMFMCQLYDNFGGSYKDTDLRMRPPTSHHQQGTRRHNFVHNIARGRKNPWPEPPSNRHVAKVARYIVHTSDWASIATNSIQMSTFGFPFADVLSLSDGPVTVSSGVPYMYMAPKEMTSQDILKDARASISVTNALSDYCHGKRFDPFSPLCARILISGHVSKVDKGSGEEKFAMDAVFSRHPEMQGYPKGHQWFFAKMNITHIFVLDFFGGSSEVSVEDYFKVKPF